MHTPGTKERRSTPWLVALSLLAAAGLVVLGARLVASERALAETTVRERLAGRAREGANRLLAAAARLAQGPAGARVDGDGRFLEPAEPRPIPRLANVPGRDPEGGFYLRQAEQAEARDEDADRATALYRAAAGEERAEETRRLALYRLSALHRRLGETDLAEETEHEFTALLTPELRSTLEALVVRSRRPDDELAADLAPFLGGPDDAVAAGLLAAAGLEGDPVHRRRLAEIATMRRLRPHVERALSSGEGAALDTGRVVVWSPAEAGGLRLTDGPAPSLPPGVALAGGGKTQNAVVETVEVGGPFGELRIAAAVPRREIAIASRRSVRLVVAALAAVLLAGTAALVLTLRAARREARAAREREAFVTRVGHDLRTPLTLIRMYAETIAEGRVSDPAEAREFAGVAAREAERLTGLVGSVLDLARVSREDRGGARRSIDLAALARDVAGVHEPLLARAGVELAVDAAESAHVLVDPAALRGAVSNLLENVGRHAASGGEARLSVERRDGVARLVVADRGPGLPPGMESAVFDRFVRGPEAGAGGAGLGLALVREAAEKFGGSVTARNRKGGGAEIEVELPLALEEPEGG